jgi:hypothetical protein
MNIEVFTEFAKLLGHFQPGWVLGIIVAAILSYRSPQLIKEFFAGVCSLLVVWRQNGRSKKTRA